MQIAVGAIPLALIIYALAFGRNPAPGTRAGFPLIEYLSIAGLLVLAFTALWSFRYTRLAIRLADPTRRPTRTAAQRTGVDRCQGEHARDRIVDAGHAFRSRAASDLFSPHTTGRRSGYSDHRGAGELGIRSRHSRPAGLASHHVRGGHCSRFQSLASIPDNAAVGRIS